MANGLYKEESLVMKKRGIRDMDAAVLGYFDNVLDIRVNDQNGNSIKVPVFFATAERGFVSDNPTLLDQDGTLIKPFIRLRRTDLDRTNSAFYGSPAEAESIQISKQIHGKTNNLQNLSRARWGYTKPQNVVYEIYTVPFPDYFVATYELEIETSYIGVHTNEILETIFQNLDYVNSFKIPDYGTKSTRKDNKGTDGFFYVGFLDPDVRDESNLDDYSEQERIIKNALSFRVGGIIIGNTQNMPEATAIEEGFVRMRKYYSSYKITFNKNEETIMVDTPEEMEEYFR